MSFSIERVDARWMIEIQGPGSDLGTVKGRGPGLDTST